jgi:hypothetical protein
MKSDYTQMQPDYQSRDHEQNGATGSYRDFDSRSFEVNVALFDVRVIR